MGVPSWSTVPAENAAVDPFIPARQDAAARDYVDAIQGVMAGVAAFAADQNGVATTGIGNDYLAAPASPPAALADGVTIVVLIDRDNTGPATLTVGSLAKQPWQSYDGSPIEAGELTAGRRFTATYSATAGAWRSFIPFSGDVVLDDGIVTNPKLAAAPALTLKGNAANTSGQPTDLAPSAVRAVLGAGSPEGLATLGTDATLPLGQLPTVPNTKLATAPPTTLKGNATDANAQPSDLSPATVRTILGAGTAGGLATLDGNSLIPEAQLPPPGAVATAGQVVGGQKVLVGLSGGVQHASADTQAHFGKVVGISVGAALAGAQVRYVSSGAMTDPSFSFIEGPVYLGLNGNLTQAYPTIAGGAVFAQQVATATTANRIVIAIQPPVLLA